jgi:CheY-like chemotaxis protein
VGVLRVLLVEDDLTTANALKFLLKSRGYEVTIAPTLAEALDRVGDSVDAVILDLMLPDGDGADLLAHIRRLNLPIRVVVTTAVSDSARIDNLKSLDPHRILRKPVDFPEILNGLLES